MYQQPITHTGFIRGWPPEEDILRRFVQDNIEPLTGAAISLAGTTGWHLVDDIKEGITQPGPLTRRIKRKLARLVGILDLENVQDETSEEAACFALIDPMDSIVAEICLLADGLREALDKIDIARDPDPLP